VNRPRLRWQRPAALALGAVALAAIPASAALNGAQGMPPALARVSQSVAMHWYLQHPSDAPAPLRAGLAQLASGAATPRAGAPAIGPDATPFNRDDTGLPQNEESITACRSNTQIVLGGTNDYRGLLNRRGNFTGWHFSNDGGVTLANEGLLPDVRIGGVRTPSGGDPVVATDDETCNLYAADLNFGNVDFANLAPASNGIGVYRTDAATLASCPGGDDPSCWPVRRAVAVNDIDTFLDKEWMTVGRSGDAGVVVWIVYSDFNFNPARPNVAGFTAQIKAVRCSADLSSCTEPQLLSGRARDIQFSDVTIAEDGKVYVSWTQVRGELKGKEQRFEHKLRVAKAGSTRFGPIRDVVTDDLPLPFGGFLHANDFRIASVPKNEVLTMPDGHDRVFLIYDTCLVRILGGTVCEEPQIKLTYSDDDGRTWSEPSVISEGGDNYFPTIAADRARGTLAAAWYTHRFDPVFHNRQDVELVTLDAGGAVQGRQRVTDVSNETEADPLLLGNFIGDYFEVFAHDGNVWVHFNANYRSIQWLGQGVPVPQQDNFLTVMGE
jgi:hypothetical protein